MVAQLATPGSADLRIVTEIRGAPAKLFTHTTGGEVVISGPAGTGKTRAILEWLHRRCATESSLRVLMLRKTQESLKASALVTYTTQVLHAFDGKQSKADGVLYYGGSGIRPADLTYQDTGSKIVIAGMDRISKVLSTEWDVIYVNECTELTLAEWEQLSSRIDRPRMGITRPLSLLLGDCNPDAPTHWIKQRERDKKLELWPSKHEHNPAMWDKRHKVWTGPGQRYIDRLDRLTGVRFQRLRLGKWVAAEGQVYEMFDEQVHSLTRAQLIERNILMPDGQLNRMTVRDVIAAVDWGFTNAGVINVFAVDGDGRLYQLYEVYQSRKVIDWWLIQAKALVDRFGVRVFVCDPSEPGYIEQFNNAGLRAEKAKNAIKPGITATMARLAPEQDSRPRLYFSRDALASVDQELKEVGKPTRTTEEILSYVWATAKKANRPEQEVPVDEHNHGLDTVRYAVAYVDLPDQQAYGWDQVAAAMMRGQG